jgi:D-alanyl-D-alanine carboxypeptidase-like protein
MSGTRRWLGRASAALVGALVGASVMLAAASLDSESDDPDSTLSGAHDNPGPAVDEPERPARRAVPGGPIVSRRPSGTLLAWAPGGTPLDSERVIEGIRGVRAATTVRAGLDWIVKTRSPNGVIVDRAPTGLAIPFEVAVVNPADYAAFVAPAERDAILALRPGEVLLAETAAQLRRARPGMRIVFTDRAMRVAGVVSDVTTNGYEAIMRAPLPAWERVDVFVLAAAKPPAYKRIRRSIEALLLPGQRLRFRVADEQPFQRYGDAVHPQMILKKNFGEFAARPLPNGQLEIDPGWSKRNLRTARVPVLGEVVCNRGLFPQLREAMHTIEDRGLAHLISNFGGCFGPRFIGLDPDGRISHHAWGVAFDINVRDNPYGAEPNLDPDVVAAIEQWGFTWGGRWIIPDGMHFEWQRWP